MSPRVCPGGRPPHYAGGMVNLTRIYTRTGDKGTTALGDMSRTAKTDLRIAAYADANEANAVIGTAIALGGLSEEVVKVLTRVQNDLFDVGADLSTPVVEDPKYPPLRVERGVRRQAGGRLRPLPGGPGEAPLLHPPGRHTGRGAPAPGVHGRPPCGALHVGGHGGARRDDEPADRHLPEPPVGPAVHPGARGQQGAGGRAVGPRRGALSPRPAQPPARPRSGVRTGCSPAACAGPAACDAVAASRARGGLGGLRGPQVRGGLPSDASGRPAASRPIAGSTAAGVPAPAGGARARRGVHGLLGARGRRVLRCTGGPGRLLGPDHVRQGDQSVDAGPPATPRPSSPAAVAPARGRRRTGSPPTAAPSPQRRPPPCRARRGPRGGREAMP